MENNNQIQSHSHDNHNNNSNHIEEEANNNNRYVDLDIVYSTTTPCSSNNYSNAMSKKVTANKFPSDSPQKPPIVFYYSRSRLRRGNYGSYDSFMLNLKNMSLIVKTENVEQEQFLVKCSSNKKRKKKSQELVNLGLGLDESVSVDDARKLRGSARKTNNASVSGGKVSVSGGSRKKRKKNENVGKENGEGGEVGDADNGNESTAAASRTRRWVRYVLFLN